ncbi:MAG: tetratricopeptide repeat protein [Planctomycetes bacterium]|nr:tetratricopeptide repeat protein [Planctomycetota bacterium]
MGAADALSPGAAAALRRLVKADDPAGAVRLADDLLGDGEFGGARAVLDEAGRRWPADRRVAIRRLELDLRYKRFDEFDAVLARAVEQHPTSALLRMLEARRHEATYDFEAAVTAYQEAARLRPDDAEPVVRGTRALRALGRNVDALAWAREAIAHHEDSSLHAAAGYALIGQGKPDEAAEAFRRAHRLQPDWGPWLDDLAGALMLAERWKEAVRIAVRSLQQSARNERAWTVYAVGHQHLGDDRRAEQGYKNALKCARVPSRAQGNYGMWLSRQPGRELEAHRLLSAALEAHPEWEEAHQALDRVRDAAS